MVRPRDAERSTSGVYRPPTSVSAVVQDACFHCPIWWREVFRTRTTTIAGLCRWSAPLSSSTRSCRSRPTLLVRWWQTVVLERQLPCIARRISCRRRPVVYRLATSFGKPTMAVTGSASAMVVPEIRTIWRGRFEVSGSVRTRRCRRVSRRATRSVCQLNICWAMSRNAWRYSRAFVTTTARCRRME